MLLPTMLVDFVQWHLLWAIWTWTIDMYLYIVIVIMNRRLQRNRLCIVVQLKWKLRLLFHENPDDDFDGGFQLQSDGAADPLKLEWQGHCWETQRLLEYLQRAMENCRFCRASW